MAAEVRAAKNEALFRAVNERIGELMRSFRPSPDEVLSFLCECDDARCHETVAVTILEYEDVRADDRHFLLVPGHVNAGTERPVRQTDRFVVVEKLGVAAAAVDEAAY